MFSLPGHFHILHFLLILTSNYYSIYETLDFLKQFIHVSLPFVMEHQITSILLLIFVLCRFSWKAQCQTSDPEFHPLLVEFNRTSNPELLPLVTKLIYKRLSNLTSIYQGEVSHDLAFCIKDQKEDWNAAFNFTTDLEFLSTCIKRTKGDITQRLCTAAEIKFYFRRYLATNYLRPNENCNLTTWNPGSEPGWACRVDFDQLVDLKNSRDMPTRASNCNTCCEGFFCPQGLTCMIPCPLGSYCPLAELNVATSMCDPYHYQLPHAQLNHTCGGADSWADVRSTGEIFCSAGSYCPSTVKKIPCSDGHYCRKGSRSENKCFKLTSCKLNTATQGIRLYGAILIAALSALLIIIYYCSDHVLHIRERRNARSREAAARSVQRTKHARERWKATRDIAKKHALGLQRSLSHKFSRQKGDSARQPEDIIISDQARTETDEEVDISRTSQRKSSEDEKATKKGAGNSTESIHDLEGNFNHNQDFNLETSKTLAPMGKYMHANTQIFKYVYGTIEKEKALQHENINLTFSGVIKMDAEMQGIMTRPVIEVSFRELTLTLKGTNKYLMRCVTGKIRPGRVSAVMGPSGAGKTTFLNALAGKATGCKKTGLILINGKNVSIHSYRKIIGFVPQDDTVHGNLTIDENLMFSANCRLSADMPKADKVLIIERVIDSLGLQHVRDSLVGTVENRGISGGQRKRVNVGMEMVMEPSLLILDEPTSGLDSSSSQLLLRALRREALEGVNICTVVHQPSYGLFKMFDDLILLAKGGLTVYHGPVKNVEEYFAGLGVIVPDRVNPPDYFIDLLEGVVPSTSIDMKQLPLRWMLHNGYPIPRDMQLDAAEVASSSRGQDTSTETECNADVDRIEVRSFAGDLWEDVKLNAEIQQDNFLHNFLMLKDLSNRRAPGVLKQYKYYIGRVSKQRLRESKIQAVDFMILFLAGACLGLLAKMSDENFGLAALLCKIAALRSFSQDKLIYWRESSSGMSSFAYFLSKDTVDHFNTLVKPVVYLSMFYFFNNPRSSFMDYYIVLVFLVYCVTGVAYVFSIFLEPGAAQLWSVLLPVVLTLVSTQQSAGFAKTIANLCYPKWALQAFVISNAERYSGVWLITRCGSLMKSGYDIRNWNRCIVFLFLYGAAFWLIC
ncbi:hypothetical protein C5167_033599 [Papaver somniferum]|uniref:ABC transporter domain-containing protein n=1 Tax=Papaver somniferum TaxID=3469 RepID=A0A4Y7KE71_PAPSO|nr:hypothetical protein C5167_033599 [Papaver somniferum]